MIGVSVEECIDRVKIHSQLDLPNVQYSEGPVGQIYYNIEFGVADLTVWFLMVLLC